MTLEQLKEEGCPFCDESKIKSEILVFDDVIVFTPLNPVCEGHTLVVPRQHVTDFTDNPEVTALVIEHASRIAQMRGGDYNLITSKGRSATQSVFHLHVHLIPRKAEDGLLLPWTGKETLHHQLQKAREEERGRCIKVVNDLKQQWGGALDLRTADFVESETKRRIIKNIQHGQQTNY